MMTTMPRLRCPGPRSSRPIRRWAVACLLLMVMGQTTPSVHGEANAPERTPLDPIRQLQHDAVIRNKTNQLHWGADPNNYIEWDNHSNRLIPVYTFGTKGAGKGVDLESYTGQKSPYRDGDALTRLYSAVPKGTLNPEADYLDQTNIHDIQKAAAASGKKHLFLVVFDGMCWHATRAAAMAKSGQVYQDGRGTGLHFLDYDAAGTSQYGYMVTSPYCNKIRYDVNSQAIGASEPEGGFDASQAGPCPWSPMPNKQYIKGQKSKKVWHTYTDSAASATSMNTGIKTYNAAINVAPDGKMVEPLARKLQQEGFAVGAVTSVPISHATPAATYANNVDRNDYQDLSRDLLGLPSISHPAKPLPGIDVLIGAGWGVTSPVAEKQGTNYVPGNYYLTSNDERMLDRQHGGQYYVSQRTRGVNGTQKLLADAKAAASDKSKFFGFYGTRYEHLPYRTADGNYNPTINRDGKEESYNKSDLNENPSLATMMQAAMIALTARSERTWLMVEPGDVDFASHDNNIDNMIGAVHSGDDAVRAICEWVEKNSNWDESLLVVTADHGHYLVIEDPQQFATGAHSTARRTASK